MQDEISNLLTKSFVYFVNKYNFSPFQTYFFIVGVLVFFGLASLLTSCGKSFWLLPISNDIYSRTSLNRPFTEVNRNYQFRRQSTDRVSEIHNLTKLDFGEGIGLWRLSIRGCSTIMRHIMLYDSAQLCWRETVTLRRLKIYFHFKKAP